MREKIRQAIVNWLDEEAGVDVLADRIMAIVEPIHKGAAPVEPEPNTDSPE
jgi:hypothetical protein